MAAPVTMNGRSTGMFQQFFRWEAASGVVLLFCAVAGLAWANSPWADSYFALSKTYIGISWGDHTFELSLSHWIADGLMVIFFFVVGLEIKRAGHALGFGRTFVAGLANGHMAYITTEREYYLGGYEGLATLYGPKTADKAIAACTKVMRKVVR